MPALAPAQKALAVRAEAGQEGAAAVMAGATVCEAMLRSQTRRVTLLRYLLLPARALAQVPARPRMHGRCVLVQVRVSQLLVRGQPLPTALERAPVILQ